MFAGGVLELREPAVGCNLGFLVTVVRHSIAREAPFQSPGPGSPWATSRGAVSDTFPTRHKWPTTGREKAGPAAGQSRVTFMTTDVMSSPTCSWAPKDRTVR